MPQRARAPVGNRLPIRHGCVPSQPPGNRGQRPAALRVVGDGLGHSHRRLD